MSNPKPFANIKLVPSTPSRQQGRQQQGGGAATETIVREATAGVDSLQVANNDDDSWTLSCIVKAQVSDYPRQDLDMKKRLVANWGFVILQQNKDNPSIWRFQINDIKGCTLQVRFCNNLTGGPMNNAEGAPMWRFECIEDIHPVFIVMTAEDARKVNYKLGLQVLN